MRALAAGKQHTPGLIDKGLAQSTVHALCGVEPAVRTRGYCNKNDGNQSSHSAARSQSHRVCTESRVLWGSTVVAVAHAAM